MTYPVFITMRNAFDEIEAELWNRNGRWHVTDTNCGVRLGPILVDNMPAHWIEQLRRLANLGRRLT